MNFSKSTSQGGSVCVLWLHFVLVFCAAVVLFVCFFLTFWDLAVSPLNFMVSPPDVNSTLCLGPVPCRATARLSGVREAGSPWVQPTVQLAYPLAHCYILLQVQKKGVKTLHYIALCRTFYVEANIGYLFFSKIEEYCPFISILFFISCASNSLELLKEIYKPLIVSQSLYR